MKNLRYHFPTCYAYSVKEPIGELNLKRALDEDTGVFSSFLIIFTRWLIPFCCSFIYNLLLLLVYIIIIFIFIKEKDANQLWLCDTELHLGMYKPLPLARLPGLIYNI